MNEKRKPYQTYTKEFKQEAVRLMETSHRPPTEIAMELGIRRNQLYKWKEQLAQQGDEAFKNREVCFIESENYQFYLELLKDLSVKYLKGTEGLNFNRSSHFYRK